SDLTGDAPPDMTADAPPPWRHRWLLYLAGSAALAYGVSQIAANPHGWTPPAAITRWFIAWIIIHDVLVAPATLPAGMLVRRLIPPAYRWFLTSGLVVSATLVLVALPQLRGYGRSPGNPSIQPRDYTEGLLIALAVIWGTVAVLCLARYRSRR